MINTDRMTDSKDNFDLIVAVAIGAIVGLLIGKYLWGNKDVERTLSKHLKVLTEVLEQIENVDTKEATDIKDKIQNILKTINLNYGDSQEQL